MFYSLGYGRLYLIKTGDNKKKLSIFVWSIEYRVGTLFDISRYRPASFVCKNMQKKKEIDFSGKHNIIGPIFFFRRKINRLLARRSTGIMSTEAIHSTRLYGFQGF